MKKYEPIRIPTVKKQKEAARKAGALTYRIVETLTNPIPWSPFSPIRLPDDRHLPVRCALAVLAHRHHQIHP